MRYGESAVANQGMKHLNGDLMCAIDCETTGLVAGHNDLIQVAILPLDGFLEPLKSMMPFEVLLQLKRPQNVAEDAMRVNGISLLDLATNGMDPWQAADLLVAWFEKLQLAPGKQIVPLAQNWRFDSAFLLDWLGRETFDLLFSRRHRDTMVAAAFLNDRADFQNVPCPFPHLQLSYLAKHLNVEQLKAHAALDDALTTAKVYAAMMRMFVK